MRLKVANAQGAPTLGITLLLGGLSTISPLSIDTFLPSLPTIAADFHISAWEAQQILTAYLLPFAVFSLVHGPLSDALGRRTVVLGGLALYTTGSIGCVFAPGLGLLLCCRVLQGTAAGIGSTVARAVARDLFEGAAAQKLLSSMVLVFSLAPAVAPIIGGWLHVTLGWRSVFGLLLAIGITLITLCALLLPESHPPSKRTVFHPVALLRSCWHVARGRAYQLLSISVALSIAPLFAWIGSTPAVILQRWQLKETQFYYVFIPIVAGFMLASIVGGRIAGSVPRQKQISWGFALMLGGSALGLVAHSLSNGMLIGLTQCMLFSMALGVQLSNPILSLEMLDMHPLARGAAASVQSFVTLGIGAMTAGVIAPLLHGDLRLLSAISVAVCAVAWLAWRAGQAATSTRRHASRSAGCG
ncbi:MAG TPA: multidrug effflux MFS transporter [Steroidobacteraceae bacterium]|nr:multidrug effflux MFS transporter [Steroidobacteraceae bacterium]